MSATAKKRRLRPSSVNSTTSYPFPLSRNRASTTDFTARDVAFPEVTSSANKSVETPTTDASGRQLFPAESRSLNRKSNKLVTTSTDDVRKVAVTVAYDDKTSGRYSSEPEDSLPLRIRYISVNSTSEHSHVYAHRDDVTTTSSSYRAVAIAVVNHETTEATASTVGAPNVQADGLLTMMTPPSSTAVTIIGSAVAGVVAFWTIATLCLFVAFYRRRYLRARDAVADRTITKPVKSCTGLLSSSTGNDVDGIIDRWTCSEKLLGDDGGRQDVDDDTRMYAIGDSSFQLTSSSSANLRWCRGTVGGGSHFPTPGSCAAPRRDVRSSAEARYTILRSEVNVPSMDARDKHVDGGYETLMIDATGNHVVQSSRELSSESHFWMAPTKNDWLPLSPPPYVKQTYPYPVDDGVNAIRAAKRFPKMGCSLSTCVLRSPHTPCDRHWTHGSTGKSEDDSVLANSRHRYYNVTSGTGRQSVYARFAPLQRSDTTGPGIMYANVDSTVL